MHSHSVLSFAVPEVSIFPNSHLPTLMGLVAGCIYAKGKPSVALQNIEKQWGQGGYKKQRAFWEQFGFFGSLH